MKLIEIVHTAPRFISPLLSLERLNQPSVSAAKPAAGSNEKMVRTFMVQFN